MRKGKGAINKLRSTEKKASYKKHQKASDKYATNYRRIRRRHTTWRFNSDFLYTDDDDGDVFRWTRQPAWHAE